jgi:hypothetical protein
VHINFLVQELLLNLDVNPKYVILSFILTCLLLAYVLISLDMS